MARQSWPTDERTPHLRWDRDPRSGKPRCYYRNRDVADSAQVRLREAFGSDAFVDEYQRAEASVIGGTAAKKGVEKWQRPEDKPAIVPKTLGVMTLNYLLAKYTEHPAFTHELDDETRRAKLGRFNRVCARDFDSVALGKVKIGELPYAKLTQDFIVELQEDYRDTPAAGSALVTDLRLAFKWALKRKSLFPGLTDNPCIGVEKLPKKGDGDGWRMWTENDLHRFVTHYAGQRPAEWATILLYTGARRGNATRLNDDMVLDGINPETGRPSKMLAFTVRKGLARKRRKGKEPVIVTIPILPALEACLANMKRPEGEKHWLLGWHDEPYSSDDSLTHAMTEAAKRIGLPRCTPHGLRKLGASLAAANGASHADLMAIFGWETMTQPDLYIKKFSRKRAALRAARLIELPDTGRGRSISANPTQSHIQSHNR